ncbi:MAG: Asp-tRNA(Asn)/Glu-tRNA(Gln) amidotransferase subunit GatB [Eubacteriales bacterium]|nr:Asp-tRNA(Asn)/Glu-tRNA(Gln) amidotransferase subunit GatB [Eubacteriales bacterium]
MKDSKYEAVIGLEVHIELKTKHKIFCDCEVSFGDPPNTHVCPVCLAMPGSLPVLNHEVVDFAICAGLLTNCEIALSSRIDRKNYFYPDLPKAYQLSQADEPLCRNGYVDVSTEDGTSRIRVNRIHIEEDAGKLIHTDEATSLIDMNRGGVPLIEIVSEPDIHSADEAVAYLRKLRSLVRYTGISDGRMNEGSLRCDVNLSIREKGSEVLGTRAEMKNLNSFNYIARAIESEFRRQVAIVEEGGTIEQETRRYDEKTDQTTAMRSKEDAADYRYFPDPDLCRIEVTPEEIAEIRAHIPKMAEERKLEYIDQFSLNEYEAERLTEDKVVANFFETAAKNSRYPKVLSSLIMTELSPLFDDDNEAELPLAPERLATLADLLGDEKINSNTGKKVLRLLLEEDFDPENYVKEQDLMQITDRATLQSIVESAIAQNQKAVEDYRNGKEAAIKAIIGRVMRETSGRAYPLLVEEMILEEIKED